MKTDANFIGGQWLAPQGGQYLDNINPATGRVIGQIPDSDASDVEQAVQAAHQAWSSWAKTPPSHRSQYLHRLADEIEKNADELARLESLDQGKPVHLARSMDVSRAIANFRYFADFIMQKKDDISSRDQIAQNSVQRKSVGVAGLIAPWNLPLYLLTWKMAPALACGNTVVCKPSELTSLSAMKLCQLVERVGLPRGVVNMVFGTGQRVGEALVRHPKVALISFTGGTETGKKVIQSSAENFKKLSLELGGKNPNIIFADCDYDKMLATTLRSSFLNQGEICLCGSRIYVEEKIYDRFITDFVRETEKLTVGDPCDEKNFLGALVSKSHLQKVEQYIQWAREEGGRILTGGVRPEVPVENENGFYLRPTVIVGLPEDSRCVQEEIFGPVVTVAPFREIDEVCEKANGVRYGLSATVWTSDEKKSQHFARELRVGTLWVNCWMVRDLSMPFGGMKQSGLGREGGKYSLDFFTEMTTVCIRTES